ncbi:uncharacterized protein PAE49_019855 [Odontesthes bonariensis]
MGDVEISINEEGALKVTKFHSLSFLLRNLRPSGQQRRPAVTCGNCSLKSWKDPWFNPLSGLFLFVLSLGVIRTFFELSATRTLPPYGSSRTAALQPVYGQTWLFRRSPTERQGIVFLAVFTAVFAIRVLVKMKMRRAALSPSMTEEVKTISGLIQHV